MTKPTSEQVTFLAAGSGASQRTVLDKLRDVVSVKDFGAVGDGVTNDALAIQAAIDSISGNAEVVFPPGIYAIGASGINITSKTRVTLTGYGAQLKIIAVSSLPAMPYGGGSVSVRFQSCTNCTIQGFEIDGNSIACNPIGMNQCTDCIVQEMKVHDSGIMGILTAGGTRTSFLNNHIYDNASVGLFAGNTTATSTDMEDDVLIAGNAVLNNGATGIAVSSRGGRVASNRSEGNQGSGIIFPAFLTNVAKDIACVGNHCTGNSFHGIQSDAVGYVVGNPLPSYISVVGNVCDSNTSGIYAANVNAWSINGNVCRDNTNHGITVNGEFFNVSVVGNVCCDTRTGGSRTQLRGISAIEQSSTVFANGPLSIGCNVCVNNIYAGIAMSAANVGYKLIGLSVTGNTCTGSDYGIICSEVDAGSVSNTIVSGNTLFLNSIQDLRVSAINVVLGDNMYATSLDLVYALPNNSATPSVLGRKWWNATNSSATAITNFVDGRVGQEIVITATNANTTINNTATILNAGGVNLAMPSGGSISYVYTGAVWRMLWKSF